MTELKKKKKILLGLLPYWTPLIPPMAISYLKGYLERYDYPVAIVDLNIEVEFKELYHAYFNKLKEFVEESKRVNFYNIGHDVMQNHMTAHINHEDKSRYFELVEILIYQNYFVHINERQISELNQVLDRFYAKLEEYLIRLIEEIKPDIFGLTVYNHTLPASLFAFRLVKKRCPQVETLMGGGIFMWQLPLGSPELDYFLEKTTGYIDKLFVGQAQHLFLKYLEGELPGNQRLYTKKDIDNKILTFEEIGVPDLSELKIEQYQYLATQASKSCPFRCRFCTINPYFGDFLEKNPSLLVEEMTQMSKLYEKKVFLLMDSLINPIVDNISDAFLKADNVFYWDAYLRIGEEVCSIENTLKWRKAGFFRARIGTESGSQRILDLMDKHITLDQIRKSLASLAYAGVKTTTFWIIGYPGETEEDFQMTLDFVEELKDDIYEAEFNPFTYFYAGQVDFDKWVDKTKLLYPAGARDMIISQTWIVDIEPSREVTFDRLNRFIQHCVKLGIPNPYSLNEIYQADERWKKLHPNAVPPLVELMEKGADITECRYIEKLLTVKNTNLELTGFDF
ncbi:MAG TPA: radical SAM protein [Candidatus Deferrimicrobium sp.]|nr:radical SAM protein [Candidatus Kapabacteria bacterium]HLP61206.1 radical SAM protein [Candidatus Deferrimicrobium sp.]